MELVCWAVCLVILTGVCCYLVITYEKDHPEDRKGHTIRIPTQQEVNDRLDMIKIVAKHAFSDEPAARAHYGDAIVNLAMELDAVLSDPAAD